MEAQLGRRSSREAPAFRAPVEHYLVRVFAKDALPRSDEKSIEAARCELLHVRLVGQPASAHATRGLDLCLPSCVRAARRVPRSSPEHRGVPTAAISRRRLQPGRRGGCCHSCFHPAR